MTIQDLDSLLNLIKADPDLRHKLTACATPKAAQEVIAAAGYTLSIEEILSMRSNLGAMNLSDAELEGVAGGRDKNSNGDTCRNHGCPGG
jgi:predicted ribosomally synthesized peptide with nif11-like leader